MEQNKVKFTPRERAEAVDARNFEEKLGCPGRASLRRTLIRGNILTKVTLRQIHNAHAINGAPKAGILGKTQDEGLKKMRELEKVIVAQRKQKLQADLFFVTLQLPFLITVSDPMDFVSIVWLRNKTLEEIAPAIKWVSESYKKQGHELVTCQFDGESAIKKLSRQELSKAGVTFEQIASTSATKCERKIRTLKNICRTFIHQVPFFVYGQLVVWLVLHACNVINLLATKTNENNETGHVQFYGHKPTEESVVPHAWGQFGYITEHVPDTKKNNIFVPRAKMVLFVGTSAGGTQNGGSLYLDLDKYLQAICVVDVQVRNGKFIPAPMPQDIIDKMNKLAEGETPYAVPKFFLNQHEVIGNDDEEELEEPDAYESDDEMIVKEALKGPVPVLEAVPGEDETIVQDRPKTNDGGSKNVKLFRKRSPPKAPVESEKKAARRGEDETVKFVNPKKRKEPEQALQATEPRVPLREGLRQRRLQIATNLADLRDVQAERLELKAARTFINDQRKLSQKMLDELEGETLEATLTASLKEFAQLEDKKVFHPVRPDELSKTQQKKILRGSMLIKDKFAPNGKFIKTKGRFVTGGHRQDRTLYTKEETSSPTASHTAVMVIVALAALEKREVMTADIGGAFLNAEMPLDPAGDPIMVRLSNLESKLLCQIKPEYEEFRDKDGTIVMHLDKALYGCLESAKAWYNKLRSDLESIGFVVNPNDQCVFNADKYTSEGKFDEQITVVIHVDDILATCKSRQGLEILEQFLTGQYTEINAKHGKVHEYLGMIINFETPGEVGISMPSFTAELVSGIEGSATSPANNDLFTVDEKSPLLDSQRAMRFHSDTASLLYLGKRTRPDLLLAVSFLTTRVNAPTEQDWNKLSRVLRFLKCTLEKSITLCPDPELSIYAYVDASYAPHLDAKSHGGIYVTFGRGPIYVKSAKHKIVSKSSTEAEFVTLASAMSEVVWIRDFLSLQGYKMNPATIFQDNQSAMVLASRAKNHSERTKHISVRYFFVHERVAKGEALLKYLRTQDMLADVLTKPLQGELFQRLSDEILNWKS